MRQEKTHTHSVRTVAKEGQARREKKKQRMLENVITLRICQLWEITRKHIHTSASTASGKTSGIDACLLLITQLPWEGLNIYTKYRRGSRLLSLHIHNRFSFFLPLHLPRSLSPSLSVHRLLQFSCLSTLVCAF